MYQVLLYYHFTTLLDPEDFLKKHLKYCKNNHILGRIIVSKEGINGTVCALKAETETYMSYLKSLEGFEVVRSFEKFCKSFVNLKKVFCKVV
jgi:UPF0176 protein